jgi:DNA ligase D-like protein (predicted polymerase)/DNA ligase D-like protein (predicted 3'-phosphoesterase)
MSLAKYKAKRDLASSKEPLAKQKKRKSAQLCFVIQKHHARSLHYDLRLEVDGVLKSWAIPKEPSKDPSIKRLAVQVEDHPYDYKDFEGTIPSGYGAGTVKIWDKGTYDVLYTEGKDPDKTMKAGLKKGGLHIVLKGKKLKGVFHLIRMKRDAKNQWLFFKGKEAAATNEEKIYWPKEKITKKDLLDYYAKIFPWILPHLKDRPVSLKRFPEGIEGISFFQKNIVNAPSWLKLAKIKHQNKIVNYVLIQDEKSLQYLANLGSIELHPFASKIKKLHSPDFLIFDLDPKKAPFKNVVFLAKALHKLLTKIGLDSYCKTSGGTGLHIFVPLQAKYDYKQVYDFAKKVALVLHQQNPEISTLERSISKRGKKVYIDYGQNQFSKTIACVYSVRARPKATVSTPLVWKEVNNKLNPQKFTIKTIFKRLRKGKDLFLPVLKKKNNLKTALKKLIK